jgi:DNA-binding NarL/FixJ family response regulator
MPGICGLDIQRDTRAAPAEISQRHDLLTPRECEVWVLIRGGPFNRAISSNLAAHHVRYTDPRNG